MSATLERLALIQARDLELDSLVEQKGHTPRDLIETGERRMALQQELQAKEAEHAERASRIRSGELELGGLGERKRAAANSSLRAETTKEASQFQNQELMIGARLQELEEDMMPLLEEAEALEAEVTELKSQLSEIEPVLASLNEAENERIAALDEQLATLSAERNTMAGEVESKLLKIYEQVRRARKGLGLVEVADGTRCGGCNVHLQIHVQQKLRKSNEIVRCPSCGRILYLKP